MWHISIKSTPQTHSYILCSKKQSLQSSVSLLAEGQIWGRKKKTKQNKEQSRTSRAYYYFYFEYLYCCSNGASWIYFYEIAVTYPMAQKLRDYFFRNLSYWCALNTVAYRSFALYVKPEIPCFEMCVLCKNILRVICSKQKQKVRWTAIICAMYDLISTYCVDRFSELCLWFATQSTSADLVWNRIDQLNVLSPKMRACQVC